MSILSSQDRHFTIIDGNVLTSGGSLNIANGQLAVINATASPSQNGRKVLSSFANLPKSTDFQIKVGKTPLEVSRSTTNKDYESLPFKLSEIVDFKVFAPKEKGIKVDDFIIGYNGKAGTGITLKQNSTAEIGITLCGEPMYMLGYENGEVTVKLYLEAPYQDADGNIVAGEFETMHQAVENAIKVFNRMTLIGGVPITDYVDIIPVNSENVDIEDGVPFKFFNLTLCDNGDYTALGKVQAQYPDYKVVRSNRINDENSVYTIIAPEDAEIEDYVTKLAQVLKGCDDCPDGYEELEGGFVYSVSLEDDGDDKKADVEALPEYVADTAVKISQAEGGVGFYSAVLSEKLNDEDLATFIEANPTAVVSFVGSVKSVCKNEDEVNVEWVPGKTCEAIEKTFKISIPDDECGTSRLAELEAYYPNLVITEGEGALCQTTFETKVLSNLVCDECAEEFRALFQAEAPEDFGLYSWEKVCGEYSETAEMGIRVKGKEFIMSGSEQFRDDMPFIATSTRLSIAGGQPTMVAESWNTNLPFAVKVMGIASDPEALGGHLREWEDRARVYFDGDFRLEGNNYGKWALGQETRLKGLAQYIDYALTVDVKKHYQYLPHASEKITYHVLVELGRHEAVEQLLNNLAAAAGLECGYAYAK